MEVKSWTPIVPVDEVKACCLVTIGHTNKRKFAKVGAIVTCPSCDRTWERGSDDIHIKP